VIKARHAAQPTTPQPMGAGMEAGAQPAQAGALQTVTKIRIKK